MRTNRQDVGLEIWTAEDGFKRKGFQWRTTHWDENKILRVLKLTGALNVKGYRILDLGCGTATFTPYLQRSFDEVIGLDVAYVSVKIARQIDRASQYVCGDGSELPFKDAIFDAVFCGAVLHHFPEIVQPLREINRVLKEDGLVFTLEPNYWNPLSFVLWHARLLIWRFSKRWYWEGLPPLGYTFVRRKLIQSGFAILEKRGLNFAIYPATGVWKLARVLEPYLESLPLINMLGGSLSVTARKIKEIGDENLP